jgi:Mce-associated membrane protein
MEDDAGTRGLTESDRRSAAATDYGVSRDGRPSRLTLKWSIFLMTVLAVIAGSMAFGGYLALESHQESQARERANTAALSAAKECVAATQPPDAAAVPGAQKKLTECSTGDFEAQAAWYGAVLMQAYQAVDVRVQLPEMQAAVERNNDDGSILALLAFRANVSQPGMADRQNSYRVRVKMVLDGGLYKVADLDQVAQ